MFAPAAALEVGTSVTWDGRAWVLRGLDPMSVPERRAHLEDPATGEALRVPLPEVVVAPPAPA